MRRRANSAAQSRSSLRAGQEPHGNCSAPAGGRFFNEAPGAQGSPAMNGNGPVPSGPCRRAAVFPQKRFDLFFDFYRIPPESAFRMKPVLSFLSCFFWQSAKRIDYRQNGFAHLFDRRKAKRKSSPRAAFRSGQLGASDLFRLIRSKAEKNAGFARAKGLGAKRGASQNGGQPLLGCRKPLAGGRCFRLAGRCRAYSKGRRILNTNDWGRSAACSGCLRKRKTGQKTREKGRIRRRKTSSDLLS